MYFMHYLNKIKKHWKNIYWWQDRFIQRILVPILFRRNNGIYILKEKWNHLIILDACRYDIFKEFYERYDLPGKLEYRISRGCNTPQFLRENFGKFNKKLKDIIYVTTNPFVNLECKGKFYRIISVWKDNNKLVDISPKTVLKTTIYYSLRYSNKKFIVHFIQPHPLRGGRQIRSLYIHENTFVEYFYKKRLKSALYYALKLTMILPGRVVITSDHGEAFGEWIHPLIPIKIYGHIENIRIPALVKVPWLIIEEDDKRKIPEVLRKIK